MENKKILIVEDDAEQLLGLTIRLKASGYEVHSAETVASSLEAAEKARPDVILLDIGLPDGDGFQVLEKLQTSTAVKDIPVVVLTAVGTIENMIKSFDDDRVVTFLQKPVGNPELLRTLEIATTNPKIERN